MAVSRTLPPAQAHAVLATCAEDRSGAAEAQPTFATVFEQFAEYVPALLRRLGVAAADVPDLTQDVFTVVHRKLATFRGDSSLKTWVCGICLRVAHNHRRLIWVRKLVFSDDLEDRPEPETGCDRLELAQRLAALEAALSQLPAREREVFVLFEVEELSMREIAQLLGCPEKTAYTRLYAARRNVKRELTRGSKRRRL